MKQGHLVTELSGDLHAEHVVLERGSPLLYACMSQHLTEWGDIGVNDRTPAHHGVSQSGGTLGLTE